MKNPQLGRRLGLRILLNIAHLLEMIGVIPNPKSYGSMDKSHISYIPYSISLMNSSATYKSP